MMVDGVWHENITCKRCRFRHPAHLSCEDARAHAQNQPMPTGSACRWCGTLTTMLACDDCWELEQRLLANPELAKRMMEEVSEVTDQRKYVVFCELKKSHRFAMIFPSGEMYRSEIDKLRSHWKKHHEIPAHLEALIVRNGDGPYYYNFTVQVEAQFAELNRRFGKKGFVYTGIGLSLWD